MRWEELTGDLFPEAVQKAEGVCLLPLSCIERHAHHMPLGTDMLIGREVVNRIAALEPAIVFPDFIFTQVLEARHYPGCIGIDADLTIRLLENTCSEIARNGLKKIVIVNAHGGNDYLMHYFAQIQLATPRDYVVYVVQPDFSAEDEAAVKAQWDTPVDGHAGEKETSAILVIRPDLVRHEALSADKEGYPLERLKHLRDLNIDVGIWWFADHPSHYCGDGTPATKDKGELWLSARARAFAKAVRAIKDDTETKRLQDEFFGMVNQS
ncbi:MAG: creatininase family protein [Anaerolineales bacterium]|nr:creatininase family protein [Anaerolineales bacterium]